MLTPAEIDRLFTIMPGEEATRYMAFCRALDIFKAASDKAAAAAAIAARFGHMGLGGLSVPSLYRKCQLKDGGGVLALVPAKWRREWEKGMASNAEFVDHWRGLVLENRRGKLRPAWSKLIRAFCSGAEIPGVGTWREMYLKEHGRLPAEGEPCPWSERDPPKGWSLRSLARLAPDKFAREAARTGMAAAKSAYGLTVRKTRVGLPCCGVVEFDDMWSEHMVILPGNREPQRVVELAGMDRLTAHVVCYFAKVIRERGDGTRETLVSDWVRWCFHYVLCVSGIPPEGCILRGERGTAKASEDFLAALEAVNAWRAAQRLGEIRFEGGSLQNEPLAKGLHNGAEKGNPRHKGMIEQMHATLKNELADVAGEVGGGRGVQPEETGAMVKEAKRLTLMATAMGLDVYSVATPFLSWPAFSRALDEAHRRVDGRQRHNLEGWEDCGFVAGEMRMRGEASWRGVPPTAEMSPEEAGAVAALVRAGHAEYRERRLSPREAWEKSKGALKPVPEYFTPQLLGPRLRVVAKLNDHMQFSYVDQNFGTRLVVAGVAGGRMLERGREYQLWVNPMDAGKAYVCDMQGAYIGVAKVMQSVRADATPEDLAEQLGLRKKVLAEEARRVAPIARRRLREANERARANLAAFGLEDPVEAGEAERFRDAAVAGAGATSIRDLMPEPAGQAAAPSLADYF